ncbi:DUF2933 domain-containing protein [Cycloclasticus pugetii]|jgi:hypothetical protein|uniref:DUF2933 domain-containing protein n=2 Tax=Cycloclasticus TaxID=34067 RepID=UPI001C6FCEDA|nr:DUF2933 domain-containing protein [Cycloclasticus pugetii]
MIGVASYFLLVEHRQHLFQWLPFLLLALCPLMHVFMHGGHGGHGGHKHRDTGEPKEAEEEAYRRGVEEGKKQSDPQPRKENDHAR